MFYVTAQNTRRTARLQTQPRSDRIVPVASGGFAVCDDGGEGGGNRLGRLSEHDCRAERAGGGAAEFADVVLCDADQCVVFGTLVAWVLVRYEFPGKSANALVDLPFALPTAVTGIALAACMRPTVG